MTNITGCVLNLNFNKTTSREINILKYMIISVNCFFVRQHITNTL